MGTSIPAAWANLDSCHEIVAGPDLRARLIHGAGHEDTGTASTGLASTGLETTGLAGTGQQGTVVALRPAGVHAKPEDGSGEARPGRPTHGRHRRDPQVAASA
jgi:hypothetical protein